MAELTVQYPDDLLLATGKPRSAFEDHLRFELAVRLFEIGQLSLGKAAELASLSKPRFGEELGRLKIPTINLDDSEIDAELSALRESHHRGYKETHGKILRQANAEPRTGSGLGEAADHCDGMRVQRNAH